MTVPSHALPPSEIVVDTPIGPVHVISHATVDQIARLTVDSGIGAVFRPLRAHEEFLRIAQRPDGNVILAVGEPGLIVGYVLAERPVPVRWQRRVMNSRWAEVEAIVEMGAIEVSRNYRRLGLAERMLQVLVSDPQMQDKIIIASAMRPYWDLAGTGMDARRYRDALVKLLESVGFAVFPTRDRDIISDPLNTLLAWFGPQASADDIARFHELRMRA